MLETIEELHILQPGSAIHVSARTPERFLRAGCKVIRQGHGYPSVFNPDVYVQELMRQGKSLRDAREEVAAVASRWALSGRRRTC